MIYILMIGAVLWLFVDNYFLKQRAEQLKERVRFLEFYTFPKEKKELRQHYLAQRRQNNNFTFKGE